MSKVISLILIAEILNTAGQILFKKSANVLVSPSLRNLDSYLRFIRDILVMPAVWLGLGAMGLALVFWLMALAQSDLSFVFPIGSSQYVLTLFAAQIFLGEKIDRMKLSGTLFIVAGIVLIAVS